MNSWISIEEALPEPLVDVLIMGKEYAEIACMDGCHWMTSDGYYIPLSDAEKWQPLAE